MLNILEFILGYILGVYTETSQTLINKEEYEKCEYIPKFNGYYRNEGTSYHEEWEWIEPIYRKRYLNIYKSDKEVILKNSWFKDECEDESIECKDQKELEIEVKSQKYIQFDSTITYETENKLVYLNVELKEDIKIFIDECKKKNSFENISCMDLEEAEEVLEAMKNHYSQYRVVEIIDNVNI